MGRTLGSRTTPGSHNAPPDHIIQCPMPTTMPTDRLASCAPQVKDPGLAIGPLLSIQVFKPEDLDFRLREWLKLGAQLVSNDRLLERTQLPVSAVVGDLDRLLPSIDEADRLKAAVGKERWRGTTVVQGAGHASTLGNRVDLLAAIRDGFSADFDPPLPGVSDLVARAKYPPDEGDGWDRGLLDRTFPPLKPDEYTRWNRGGDKHPKEGAAVL